MGLDVAFNREQAIAAGIEYKTERNGDDVQITDAQMELDNDPECPMARDYLDWLNQDQDMVRVPGMEYWRDDDGGKDHIVVRANRWGDLYHPLTEWLKANNIDWTEA